MLRLLPLRDDRIVSPDGTLNAQTIVWFGLSGGALIFALSLLRQRYITKTPRAMQSRGSFTMFAILMFIFAIGAFAAGWASH